jgi:hypothetical protein
MDIGRNNSCCDLASQEILNAAIWVNEDNAEAGIVDWVHWKDQVEPEDEISSEGRLHCEINEVVQDHIDGQQNVDIADLAARMSGIGEVGARSNSGAKSSIHVFMAVDP